ncbi:HEAT repeat domain-containing protein [Halomonas sp. RA08-2]|uniref:HEAT repeat domain-containing protein n=1 Tax=Halomonas sp. RA08-2 TaxID=3440842 RepID=UPI003EEABE1A
MPSDLWLYGVPWPEWLQGAASLPEDPVLRLAVYSAMALGGLTLLVMAQVLVVSELAARRERRQKAFVAEWRPRLVGWTLAEEAPATTPPRREREVLWFLLLWARLHRQLRGVARERLNALFFSLDMTGVVLSMLDSRRAHRRLVALACLGHLGSDRFWSDVTPLLEARNPLVALASAQALVAMDPRRAMDRLVPLIARRRDLAMPRLQALCRQAGPAAVTPPLLEGLATAATPHRDRLAALLGGAEPARVAPWARRCLAERDTVSEALCCAALACLGELGDPRDHALLSACLVSDSPRVRFAALRALRRQARREDEALLLPHLGDRDWWVRQAAADSLVGLPGIPRERLEALCEACEDRYGRDALRRAMAEGARP